jgi:cellulose synthase/poly-beta-1,6-N-acetylglucosamine synthase-like glycosyltransferase
MLARLLESVRRNAPGVDLLVVDSASGDGRTRQVAEAAGVSFLRVDRPGLSIARNAGIRAVETDVVVFTDDDCVVTDDWTRPLVGWFTDARVGVVTGEMVGEDADPDARAAGQPRRSLRTVEGLDLGHGANMAFRREAVLDVGGFDENLGAGMPLAGAEDLDMFCRLLHAGWTGVRDPRSAVVHAHTREGTDYVRLMRGYARGSGAALVKMVRLDRAVGLTMTTVVLRRLARRLLSSPASRGGRRASVASARGLLEGAVAGARLPVADGVFVAGALVPAAAGSA